MRDLLIVIVGFIFFNPSDACCGLSLPTIPTGCCMQYQPPSIIGYQKIPIYKRVRVRIPVPPSYVMPQAPPPSYIAPAQQFAEVPPYSGAQPPAMEIPQSGYQDNSLGPVSGGPAMAPLYQSPSLNPGGIAQVPISPSGYHGLSKSIKLVRL